MGVLTDVENFPLAGVHRNMLDAQRAMAIRMIDKQIAKDWAAGYGDDVDKLLERRKALVELIATGPHS